MVKNQIYLFFIFNINGVIIGLLFDIFRILRKSFKTPNIITYFEDILFWILTGITFIFFIYNFTNGQIRLFMILGLLLGIIIYMITISRTIIKCAVSAINLFKKILRKMIKFFSYPICIIIRFLGKIILKIKTKFFCSIYFKLKNKSNKKILDKT